MRKVGDDMSYQPYADVDYYKKSYKGTLIPEEELEKALINASRHIDVLTYNRIVGRGINVLTEYQQNIIKEVCCDMAEFEFDNADMINSVLENYSINGVSMTFGSSWNVSVVNGIAIKKEIYGKLNSTGLCSRIIR